MNEKTINIKMMSDTALAYLEKNIDRVTEKSRQIMTIVGFSRSFRSLCLSKRNSR